MALTTPQGNPTIDPPMQSLVEGDMRRENNVSESIGELGDSTTKKIELS